MSATTEKAAAPAGGLDAALIRATMLYITVVASGIALANLVFGGLWGPVTVFAAAGHLQNTMLFIVQDAPVAVFMAICTWLLLVLPARIWQRPARWFEGRTWLVASGWTTLACGGLAMAVFVLAWLGRHYVHHDLDFVGDEFMPGFQAHVFMSGHLLMPIDPAWKNYVSALEPIFTYVNLEHGLWGSAYRPGHAMLRAAALWLGDDGLANAALAAGSVLLIAHIARVTFPNGGFAPLLAACLLASSAQFLALAVSGFSYTAHLFFCLLWLALFLRADLKGHVGAALVGAFAIGLHQIHVHPLFAAPFLLAHLAGHYGRSLPSLAAYAVAYAVAIPFWVFWQEIAVAIETGSLQVLIEQARGLNYMRSYADGTTQLRSIWHLIVVPEMWANILRFAAWLSPAVVVLVLMALPRWRTLPLTAKLAAAGVALMIAAHAVLMPIQIHSWGYRYAHPILGNLVLLAVAGFPANTPEMRRAAAVTGALLVASVLVLLPWRAAQIEARLAPRAAAMAAIAAIDADVVVLDEGDFWFGIDLIHNDPFLRQRPLVMSARRLTPQQLEALSAYRVVRIGPADLAPAGLGRGDWLEPRTMRLDRAE